MAVRIRSIYDPSEDVGIDFRVKNKKTGQMEFVPGLTKQADKDSCDINLILSRYAETGVLPDMIRANPRYGDFSSVPSYQEAFELVARAHEQFEALDVHVRDRFKNDPVEMLKFCEDPRNGEEMVKLGLAVPRPPVTPSQPAPGMNNTAPNKSGDGGSLPPAGTPAK